MPYDSWSVTQVTVKEESRIWDLVALGLLDQAEFYSTGIYANFRVDVLSESDQQILPSISYSVNLTTFKGRQERYYYDCKIQRAWLMDWSN